MEKNERPAHRKVRKKICHFCAGRVEEIDYNKYQLIYEGIYGKAKSK